MLPTIWKKIEPSDVRITPTKVHKTQNLTSADAGVSFVQWRSGSYTNNHRFQTISGSHYDSLKLNFYLSASKPTRGYYPSYLGKYYINHQTPQHIWKFHSSGSILSIGQKHFGERIKKGTFELTDNSTSKTITLKDDERGNLYAISASISQSNSSVSSSGNYIGNIFYEQGIITINDTGSYSSSISYTDVGTGNYSVGFKSTHTIYTQEYTVRINPKEFTGTHNPSARGFMSASNRLKTNTTIDDAIPFSYEGETKIDSSGQLKNELTSSNWLPYANSIGFYREGDLTPVMVAKLPQPVKMTKDTSIIFKISVDI